MYATSDFRKGLKIEINGEPFIIVDFLHVKPGKGGAFVRTTLKSLLTGNVIDRTFRSGEKVDRPDLEEKSMQFLYEADQQYYFMDAETYEQLFITQEQLGDSVNYLGKRSNKRPSPQWEADWRRSAHIRGTEGDFHRAGLQRRYRGRRHQARDPGDRSYSSGTPVCERRGYPEDRHPHRKVHRTGALSRKSNRSRPGGVNEWIHSVWSCVMKRPFSPRS